MRGGTRRITPAKEKRANGTFRKDRDSGRMELAVPAINERLPAPAHFDRRLKKKWTDVIDKVLGANILHSLDADFLQVYVENWFLAEDALADITKNGAVLWIERAGGRSPLKNPNCLVYSEAIKVVRQMGEKFGLSARDRQSIKVQAPKQQTSKILELMQGGKTKTG